MTNLCKNQIFAGKMWIFLVLMTIANLGGTKRVRKEPRQISVVSTGEESGSELDPKLCMLRTRKRVMTSVASIGITLHVNF